VLLLIHPYDLFDRHRRPDRQLTGTPVDDPARVNDLGGWPPLPGLRVELQRRGRGPHDPAQVELLHANLAARSLRTVGVEPTVGSGKCLLLLITRDSFGVVGM
jgi:hypothetical protein